MFASQVPELAALVIATHNPNGLVEWLTALGIVAGAFLLLAIPIAIVVSAVIRRRGSGA